ncbi:hypothetical protein [Brachyspira pilosicoli]|uniref:DUF5723 domain-containing protein n=1 Tax=Brachyspira pilosicoli TaxID=52584 RepID=A0A5C8F3L5_BRAPL|nr:hypothetical protein [Brachyspira pilosicoli]TXJ43792.1 hypothetical protein EPJ72_03915 [Brachyspira pilosicoli]
MKKLILILTALCITFAYSFAQIPTANMNTFIDNLDNSAVKRATAGEFSTDTDKLNAKNVFDLNRTIFSAGYVPGFNSSSSTAVQAFIGVPILNNAMYFGVAGVYSMNETRADYNPYGTPSTEGITLGKKVNTGSTFAIRPVFKINDMVSIHYLIARGNSKQVNEGYTSFDPANDKNFTAITNTTGNSQWVHEVAVGLVFGEMKLKIPVRLTINDAGNSYSKQYTLTKTDVPNVSSSESQSGTTNTGNNTMNLSIAPEFSMPLVAGPMTGLNFGLTLGFDIYGMGQKFDSYSTEKITYVDANIPSAETKNSTVTNQDKVFNMNVDINAYPTLEWSLADDRVRLVMEPKVGLTINVTNAGNVKVVEKKEMPGQTATESTAASGNKTSLVVTTPYVELPFGTAFKPVDWFEFRAGVSYRLGFAMTSGSYEALTGGKYKSFNYAFESTMNLFTGMGFIVGEDFFIDLFLAARAGTAGTTTPSPSLLGIDSWGAQLSYRL